MSQTSPETETVEPVNLKDLRWMGYGICRHAADEIAYLRAEVERLTAGHAQRQQVELTEGQKHTLERIANARAAGIKLHPFWLEFEKSILSDTSTNQNMVASDPSPENIEPRPEPLL